MPSIITSQLVDAKIAMEIMESHGVHAFAVHLPHFIQDPFGSLAGAAGSGLSRRGSTAKASKKKIKIGLRENLQEHIFYFRGNMRGF
jgi:hypothetical protein